MKIYEKYLGDAKVINIKQLKKKKREQAIERGKKHATIAQQIGKIAEYYVDGLITLNELEYALEQYIKQLREIK